MRFNLQRMNAAVLKEFGKNLVDDLMLLDETFAAESFPHHADLKVIRGPGHVLYLDLRPF